MKSLTTGGNTALGASTVTVEINWSPIQISGCDVDASAFLLNSSGKVRNDEDFIFSNQSSEANGGLCLAVSAGKHIFTVNTNSLPNDIEKISFVITIHGNASFAGANQVNISVSQTANFSLSTHDRSETTLILGELYKRNGQWKFRAIGQGFTGGLGPLATNLGVGVVKEEKETKENLITNLISNKKILFVVAGSIGGFISGFLSICFSLNDNPFTSWVLTGALDAAIIGTLILYGQAYYQTKKILNFSKMMTSLKVGALLGAGGGLLALIVMITLASGDIGRIVGWSISGAVAGYVVSKQVPNMNKIYAIIAGSIGAAIGCLMTYIDLGYITGVVVTGAAIGLVVASAEEILRKSWVEVTEYSHVLKSSGINIAKEKNKYTLTLGNEPIQIGYSSDMDILLKGDKIIIEKKIATLTVESGKFFMINLKTGTKTEILKDSPIRIENCELKICY